MDSTSYMREYTRKNKDKINSQRRARYSLNSEPAQERAKEYYTENRDSISEKRKENRPKLREQERSQNDRLLEEVLQQYGKKCAKCGFNSDIRILQLDHINGGGNRERREIGTRGIRRKALKNPELYQLLCPNCN